MSRDGSHAPDRLQPPRSNPTSPRLLDSSLPPPPPSPARIDFAAPSPALSTSQAGGYSTASSSYRGFTSSSDGFADSPATALTSTTSGSLDPLQLPPSSYSEFAGGGDSLLTALQYGGDGHLNAIPLTPPDIIHFNKGNQSFKFSYERMHVFRTSMGEMRHIELSGSDPHALVNSTFVHTFPHTVFPVPHMEMPMTAETKPPYIISFLDVQVVTASGVTFSAQPHYYFSNWQDCVNFQETLLGKRVVFVAESHPGAGVTILFFANSQPKANKRYLWLSGAGIDSVDRKRDTVTLKLNPDALEILSTLRTLYIDFLYPSEAEKFCSILDPEPKGKPKHKGKAKA